jgi:hypothetical protein
MTRFGLGIASDGTRAVLLRRGTIVWRDEERCRGDECPVDTIPRLLGRAPLGRVGRPRVVAAIGPAWVQLRRLAGLPATGVARHVLSAAVSANAGRYFLGSGVTQRTPELIAEGGWWWGAAFEEPTVTAVGEACRRAGCRLEGCVPSAWVVREAGGEGTHRWRDGEILIELTIRRAALASVRRVKLEESALPCPSAPPTPEIPRSADAIAAARAEPLTSMFLRVDDQGSRRRRARVLLAVWTIACAGACLLAPALGAMHARRSAEATLAMVETNAEEVRRVSRELSEVSETLDHVARFANSRRSMLGLLADLGQVLPESTAIASLRVDSAAGTLIALSASGADMMPALAESRSLEAPQLVGAITPDMAGGARLQRLTLRFRWRRGVASR